MRDKFGQSDDGIFLILGTYNDNRNSYGYDLNPLGTQSDFRIMDDGRTLDYNWDTEWSSSAAKYEWGWFAEMAIPFTNIKLKKILVAGKLISDGLIVRIQKYLIGIPLCRMSLKYPYQEAC